MRLPLLLTLAALALPACAEGAPYSAVTIIGDGPPGTLRLPQAITVAATGEVLVGDQFGGAVQRFSATGAPLGALGSDALGPGLLGAVSGIATAPSGMTYLTEAPASRVVQLAPDGHIVRTWGGLGQGRTQLHFAAGTAIGTGAGGGIVVGGGHVFVADTGNGRIVRFDMDGGNAHVIKVPGRHGQRVLTQGVAYGNGHLYVPDNNAGEIIELTAAGKVVARSATPLDHPYDAVVASNGQIVVAENSGHRIVVLDRKLRVVRSWGGFGHGPGKLDFPRAITVGRDGLVYVADTANNRIQVFTLKGKLVRRFGIDGRGAGRLTQPQAIAAGPEPELRVADTVTGRVLRFGFDGGLRGSIGVAQSITTPVHSDGQLLAPSDLASLPGGDIVVRDAYAASRFTSFGDFTNDLLKGAGGGASGSRVEHIAAAAGGRVALLSRLPDRVVIVDPATGAERAKINLAAAKLLEPVGLAFAGDGSVWVLDKRPGRAVHVAATGAVLGSIALPSEPADTIHRGGVTQKLGPTGIAVDSAGTVWVTNTKTDRVDAYSPSGTPMTGWGGRGTAPGLFAMPGAIAVDCAGGVSVADTGNHRIQRFTGAAAAGVCSAALPPTPSSHQAPTAPGLKMQLGSISAKGRALRVTMKASCSKACTIGATATARGYVEFSRAKGVPRSQLLAHTRDLVGKVTITSRSARGAVIVVQLGASDQRVLSRFLKGGQARRTSVVIATRATASNGLVTTSTKSAFAG